MPSEYETRTFYFRTGRGDLSAWIGDKLRDGWQQVPGEAPRPVLKSNRPHMAYRFRRLRLRA